MRPVLDPAIAEIIGIGLGPHPPFPRDFQVVRDAVSLGVRLARTLGAELELRLVVSPDDVTTPRVTSDKFHEMLAEQGSAWLDEALRMVPDDVTARGAVLVDESVAGALSET